MEQRTRDLNNPSTTEEHDSFPFPRETLRSISSTNKPQRSSMHSNDSGSTSPIAFSRTPVLSTAIPAETSTPHPFSSQRAQTAPLSLRENLSPIQQFIRKSATRMARNSVKSRPKEPKYNRSQPNYPDCGQSHDRAISSDPNYTIATFLQFLYYMHHYLLLEIIEFI